MTSPARLVAPQRLTPAGEENRGDPLSAVLNNTIQQRPGLQAPVPVSAAPTVPSSAPLLARIAIEATAAQPPDDEAQVQVQSESVPGTIRFSEAVTFGQVAAASAPALPPTVALTAQPGEEGPSAAAGDAPKRANGKR